MYLYFYINNLASAIHAIGRIYAMRTEKGAVSWILGQLGCLELVRSPTLA